MKEMALDDAAEPGAVSVGQSGVAASGEHGKQRRAVAGLGRNREMVSLEQAANERQRLGRCRPLRRSAMTRSTSGLPSTMRAGPANVSTSIAASGQARRRLRISGVVSSASPMPAQRHDQDARFGRERDGGFGRAHRPRPAFSVSRWRSEAISLSSVAALVVARRHRVPHRPRPGRVAARARDDMDVQLRHDVAERRDVDLVAAGERLERAAGVGDLAHQLRLLGRVEVDDLDGPGRRGTSSSQG